MQRSIDLSSKFSRLKTATSLQLARRLISHASYPTARPRHSRMRAHRGATVGGDWRGARELTAALPRQFVSARSSVAGRDSLSEPPRRAASGLVEGRVPDSTPDRARADPVFSRSGTDAQRNSLGAGYRRGERSSGVVEVWKRVGAPRTRQRKRLPRISGRSAWNPARAGSSAGTRALSLALRGRRFHTPAAKVGRRSFGQVAAQMLGCRQ